MGLRMKISEMFIKHQEHDLNLRWAYPVIVYPHSCVFAIAPNVAAIGTPKVWTFGFFIRTLAIIFWYSNIW